MSMQEPTRNVGYVEEGTAFLHLTGAGNGISASAQTAGSNGRPAPSRIIETAFAFQRTAALRAAVGLDVFTAVGEGHDTSAALAECCGAAEKGVRILCDFLVAFGLLSKMDGRYAAAPDTAVYLDRHSQAFIGDALDFASSETVLKAVLSDPVNMIRYGRTILGSAEQFVAPDHGDWTTYARAVAPMMAPSAYFLAELIAREGLVERILDIAAGPGQNGIALARRVPDAQVTAVDWPSVLEIAQENAQSAGLGERWRPLPGSALEIDLGGPYDVILVPRFLPFLGSRDRAALLQRLYKALTAGGRLAVLQVALNDDRSSPLFAVMMNLNMLATTPSGQVPTAGELKAALSAAGFEQLEWYDLPISDERVVIGWKQT